MKSLIIVTLTTSILATLAPSASAQKIFLYNSLRYQNKDHSEQVELQPKKQITALTNVVNTQTQPVSPVTLVQLGHQGYFEEQGIPSNASFDFAIKTRKVTAKTLVQSAIDKGRLSANTINDQGYLNSVKSELEYHNRLR